MRRFFMAAFAATGLAITGAHAAQQMPIHTNTAGELADICSAAPHTPGADEKINFCHGFAQGAIDVELRHAGDKKPFCFPKPSPTREETISQFVSWVRAMPDRRSIQSTDGLFRFLAERFPCK